MHERVHAGIFFQFVKPTERELENFQAMKVEYNKYPCYLLISAGRGNLWISQEDALNENKLYIILKRYNFTLELNRRENVMSFNISVVIKIFVR